MNQATALFRRLTDNVSGPALHELQNTVLAGRRRQAIALMTKEGFTEKEAILLWTQCQERWSGVDVKVTEVPITAMYDTIAAREQREGASGGNASPYLVRHGKQILSARAMRVGGSYELWTSGGRMDMAHVSQFWLVSPKVAETPNTTPA